MGNATATAVDEEGTVYLAGTDGPDPIAISLSGKVLWKSALDDPEIFSPYEIAVDRGNVLVKYESGMENGYKLVTLDGNGKLVSVREEHTEQ